MPSFPFVYANSQAKADFQARIDNLLGRPPMFALSIDGTLFDLFNVTFSVNVPPNEIWFQEYGVTVGRIVNLGVDNA